MISRRRIAGYVADQIADSADTKILWQQVASYLIKNKRVADADLLARDIAEALASRGVVLGEILTAREINEKLKTAAADLIKSKTGAKSVRLQSRVDTSLLGGIIVRAPGMELDGSIKTKIMELKGV